MTRDEFFPWAECQDGHYEFDGEKPVRMTGFNIRHSRMGENVRSALDQRLRGTSCRMLGFGAGLATFGDTVRYPDALVTCSEVSDDAYVVPGVVVVCEVLSTTSGYIDRIVKPREYATVASIRRYVILENTGIGLTVFARPDGEAAWTATVLRAGETLHLPEIGIEIPVIELYEDTELA